jgi:hypothetical protein
LDNKIFDCFLLIYPNSKVSNELVTKIFNSWNVAYKYIEFEIRGHNFYTELYDLEQDLSLNKAIQCGLGGAKLFLYKLPIDTVRLRPTFSEIKPCNIFAFDLKHALRAVDRKNLVHGSTDFDEYIKDSQYFINYYSNGTGCQSIKSTKLFYSHFIVRLKLLKQKVVNRLIYTYQKSHGFTSFYMYGIRCFFVKKYKITPFMLKKWRWSSKYFLLDDEKKYFVKIPNKFESARKEEVISKMLRHTGCVEHCETIDLFGTQAIKKPWINMRQLQLDEFYEVKTMQRIVNLFGVMDGLNIHHADIKYDNLQFNDNFDHLILLDFGLSTIETQRVVFADSIKNFELYRWNDGWNLLNALIESDPIKMINNVDVYITYASLAGQYAVNKDGYHYL